MKLGTSEDNDQFAHLCSLITFAITVSEFKGIKSVITKVSKHIVPDGYQLLFMHKPLSQSPFGFFDL